MKFCKKCGTKLDDAALFCLSCGEKSSFKEPSAPPEQKNEAQANKSANVSNAPPRLEKEEQPNNNYNYVSYPPPETKKVKPLFIILPIVLLLVIGVLLFIFLSGGSPASVAQKFLDSAGKGDVQSMLQCIEPVQAKVVEKLADVAGGLMGMDSQQLLSLVPGLAQLGMASGQYSMNYTLGSEQIIGDTANIDAVIVLNANNQQTMQNVTVVCKKTGGKWYVSSLLPGNTQAANIINNNTATASVQPTESVSPTQSAQQEEPTEEYSPSPSGVTEQRFGYITNAYTSNGVHYVEMNYVAYFTGDEAVDAAESDKVNDQTAFYNENTYYGEGHYVRDQNDKLRVWPLSDDCLITYIGNHSTRSFDPDQLVKSRVLWSVNVKNGTAIALLEVFTIPYYNFR
jgi:hypothetical protein